MRFHRLFSLPTLSWPTPVFLLLPRHLLLGINNWKWQGSSSGEVHEKFTKTCIQIGPIQLERSSRNISQSLLLKSSSGEPPETPWPPPPTPAIQCCPGLGELFSGFICTTTVDAVAAFDGERRLEFTVLPFAVSLEASTPLPASLLSTDCCWMCRLVAPGGGGRRLPVSRERSFRDAAYR